MLPIDLTEETLANLSARLRVQADNVEVDGHLNAKRLMLNAADIIEHLDETGIIKVRKSYG